MATLVLLCKRPALGYGKQRLAGECGEEAAYKIAQCLLGCAVEDLLQWQGSLVISPACIEDDAWAKSLLPTADIIPQVEGNLGQRLNALDKTLRANGHDTILYIGSDCPSLSVEDYQQVASALQDNDTLLIPAEDGGVVLMGSRLPWPDLASLPWSSATLGDALKNLCVNNGHITAQFGLKVDVDTRQDALKNYPLLTKDHRSARKVLRQCIHSMIRPRLSIIIPCFNDEVLLEKLLINLQKFTTCPDEILVVDAAQNPACKKFCEAVNRQEIYTGFGVQWMPSFPCRGKQLREGAEQASGDILWFLHADAVLVGDPVKQIVDAYWQGAEAGYFSFHFDTSVFHGAKPWATSWIEKLTHWRNQWGAVYGDQGIFVTQAAYQKSGGHTRDPLFEEISLIKNLRKQHPLVELSNGLQVSPRRWQNDGWIYRSLRNRVFALAHFLGVSSTTLAHIYGSQAPACFKSRSINHA